MGKDTILLTRLNFCNPVVYFSPKLRQVSHSLLHPMSFATSAIRGGLLHTLTELLLSVILPDFLLHSSRLNYLSPQNILGVSGHPLLLCTLLQEIERKSQHKRTLSSLIYFSGHARASIYEVRYIQNITVVFCKLQNE